MALTKFVFGTDLHWGYERVGGHKKPLHDRKAANAFLQFVADFTPDVVILGGDVLDCGPVSHHNSTKPGQTEGLKLAADAAECRQSFIEPLMKATSAAKHVFITGNHEAWLTQLLETLPALEGMFDISSLLGLDASWKVIPQGGYFDLGKLTFMHGDTISGGEHVAKAAVLNYERSVRFGHFHTAATYTKNSPRDYKKAKSGVAVPCLCHKTPKYGKGRPNRWVQGWQWGFVDSDGSFADFTSLVIDGKCIGPTGKVYRG